MGDLEDLERRAADERRREDERRTNESRRARTSAAAKQRAEAKKRVESGRPPDGFWSSIQVFYAGFGLLSVIALAFAALLDASLRAFARQAIPIALLVIAAYVFAAYVTISGWRSRLAFRLEGYDTIEGEDQTDENHVPWLHFEVRVSLSRDDDRVKDVVRAALELLASQVNKRMRSDSDREFGGKRTWTVSPHHLLVSGDATRELYITGVLRRWLGREMNVVARETGAIASVEIRARYTGESHWISPS